jgi:hypothetical protein
MNDPPFSRRDPLDVGIALTIASVRRHLSAADASCPHHEVRERARLHLAHHLAAVRLDGDSLMPSSPATCLFNSPDTTSAITSRSRGVSILQPLKPHWTMSATR